MYAPANTATPPKIEITTITITIVGSPSLEGMFLVIITSSDINDVTFGLLRRRKRMKIQN